MSKETKVAYDAYRKYEIKRNPKESLSFYCNFCRKRTSHKTIVSVEISENDLDEEISSFGEYRISECSGCHSISFIERKMYSDEEWRVEEETSFPCNVYPVLEEGVLTESRLQELEQYLPTQVKRVYRETLSAIKNKLHVLAGIGLRSTLDTICRDNNIGKKRDSLEKRLDIMEQQLNLITPAEKAVLDVVRDRGNGSAHEGTILTEFDLKAALMIEEHLLDKLYVIPTIKAMYKK